MYDWKTEDIWVANGRFHWDYNHLYDLYYQAGMSLNKQRVASPFISEAIESLALYKVIDPNTWGRMIGRLTGYVFPDFMEIPMLQAGRVSIYRKDIHEVFYGISTFNIT